MSEQEPWEKAHAEWQHWSPSAGRRPHNGGSAHWQHGDWQQHRRGFFLRFAIGFGVIILLVAGAMTLLVFHFTRNFGEGEYNGPPFWVGLRCLAFLIPLLVLGLAFRAFRNVATPLADIMDAADAVADGNLTVHVPERGSREFRRSARSFNHMTEELARTDQQRRNLTADVAHELRTPLHIIQGNLEGVLDGVYQPTPEHIEVTLEETRQLARLVDDLRTLSLAEAGQLPLVHEAVDVADLLADVATSFSGQAEATGVGLRIEEYGVRNGNISLQVNGDAGRLDQVLSNLVANAIRHTNEGGTVTLTAETVDQCVQIKVIDTGEGIAGEDLPFIFDRFWRADRARAHSSGAGSGLGLAIASQLVKAHGGTITVASQPGKGTTFTVELPAANGAHGRVEPRG